MPPSPIPTTAPTDGVVAVAAGVDDPATAEVRAVVGGYVSGIDQRRYADAFAYLSPDSATAKAGLATWQQGQSTTAIDEPRSPR